MPSAVRCTLIASMLFAVACSTETSGSNPDAAPGSLEPVLLEFPSVDVAAGEEIPWDCQSITLDNPEPLYINSVTMRNDGAWHHSNWYWVPEDRYDGPDGTWNCSDRSFDAVEAGAVGGVIYAQSTQATGEAQAFEEGAVIVVPPYSRILGQIHLLNASDTAMSTHLELELKVLRSAEVETILAPMALQFAPLRIPPMTKSRHTGQCDFLEPYGIPLDFRVHYVLPHYHEIGTGMSLQIIGGPQDGEMVFGGDGRVGEPLGETMSPPKSLAGATGLRFWCDYDNPRDQTVRFGIGDQEMCLLLAFTDGPVGWAGGVNETSSKVGETADGVVLREGPCQIVALTLRL